MSKDCKYQQDWQSKKNVHLKEKKPVPYPICSSTDGQFNLQRHFCFKYDEIKDFKCAGCNNNFLTEQRKENLEKIVNC